MRAAQCHRETSLALVQFSSTRSRVNQMIQTDHWFKTDSRQEFFIQYGVRLAVVTVDAEN